MMTDREALEQTHAVLTDQRLRWKQRVQQATAVVAAALAEPTPEPTPEPEPEPTPEPGKPLVRGIFTRQSVAQKGESASTLQVLWRDVDANGWGALDALVAKSPVPVRLRPMLGQYAPNSVKALGVGPIAYYKPPEKNAPNSGQWVTVPDLWSSAEVRDRLRGFLDALAARYDPNPKVSVVFATAGMTYYGEPFIRGLFGEGSVNIPLLLEAGYTAEKDADLQRWQLDAMDAFHKTNIGLAYNPWQYINAQGKAVTSISKMAEVMDYHTWLYGERALLQNNSIRSSYVTTTPGLYSEFKARDAAKQFQCAGALRVGDEAAAIRWAIDEMGATGIEKSGTLTDAQYAAFDAELKA